MPRVVETPPPPSRGPHDVKGARARTLASLFASVGLSSSGYIAALIVSPLVAEDLLGGARWSGLPSGGTVVGMAAGASAVSAVMARHGRRRGLLVGYAVSALGGALAALAAALGSFVGFVAGMSVLGAGHSANRLTRYAAADLYGTAYRASAISWIISAGTVGSVLGPILLAPARAAASRVGAPGIAGPFLITVGGALAAAVVLALLMPADRGHARTGRAHPKSMPAIPLRQVLTSQRSQLALITLLASQVVMVIIMSMTPVHIRGAGRGLESIGLVIGAHAVGMYALSPLTGLLTDRVGRVPIIATGATILTLSGLLAAGTGGAETLRLTIALFLLGLGWNFGFVAGSALLTDSVPEEGRLRVQGLADSAMWTSSACASLVSGVLLSSGGYWTLSVVGSALALLPMVKLVQQRLWPAPAIGP